MNAKSMKRYAFVLTVCMAVLVLLPVHSPAGDFPWIDDFNLEAGKDMTAFERKMRERFRVDKDLVDGVIREMKDAAAAYLVFKLGEMSGKPVSEVVKKSKSGKAKGWGNLAKSLGIKPGSTEFHALKQRHDLYAGDDEVKGKGKDKGKGKGKGKKK